VFENILSRRIDWYENEVDISPEARDFMERLMNTNPARRLGAYGAEEVKAHPFFKSIDWDGLLTKSPAFKPQPVNLEDTEYFDARGATMQAMDDEDIQAAAKAQVEKAQAIINQQNGSQGSKLGDDVSSLQSSTTKSDSASDNADFGTFVYKNLPVLEKANEDAIRKIRHESIIASVSGGMNIDPATGRMIHRSMPAATRRKLNSQHDLSPSPLAGHPAISSSLPASPPALSPSSSVKTTQRETAELGHHAYLLAEPIRRRGSLPTKLRTSTTASSTTKGRPLSEIENKTSLPSAPIDASRYESSGNQKPTELTTTAQTPPIITEAHPLQQTDKDSERSRSSSLGPRKIDCLIADDNPISCKILETILHTLNCRCVVVRNGAQAIRYAMGGVKFDIIFMDIRMPISK
jgi:hypothetical protein